MSENPYRSSDSVRSAAPLRHVEQLTLPSPVRLEYGGELPFVTVAYETYGKLNERRDNVVLVCHAISGDSHVARHDADDEPGWWDVLVGPGKAIDTDRYFVVCSNVLGGCRGTTGPSAIDPETGRPYGARFPLITVTDIVDVQARLLDHLGIEVLRAVVGGSLGGHQAMTWAVRYPDRVRGTIAMATSPRLTSQALAFDVVGRNAIQHDPAFYEGQYYDRGSGPTVGLALARMLGHITYLSREAMTAKFDLRPHQGMPPATAFETRFAVGSYLAYQGDKFVERFDANSYITLSLAMDLFDLGDTREKLQQRLARSRCRWLVVSFSSDWLFPPEQSRHIVEALVAGKQCISYCNVETLAGHDSFLLEEKLDIYGGMVRGFLSTTGDSECILPRELPAARKGNGRTSIFDDHRLDYDVITELIPAGATVLDLGCGTGGLLARLRNRSDARVVGVEIDEKAVVACVEQGLDVIHANLEEGLPPFDDAQFDVVVLSQALQSISDTEGIIEEMLRVGRFVVVSFPNFAHERLRSMLAEDGRFPHGIGLYEHEWYRSPYRRFPSITDMLDFCAAKSIGVRRQLYLDSGTGRPVTTDPNLNADLAIFVLSRRFEKIEDVVTIP